MTEGQTTTGRDEQPKFVSELRLLIRKIVHEELKAERDAAEKSRGWKPYTPPQSGPTEKK